MLTAEEKQSRKRERMLEKSREYQLGTYTRMVATEFQRMIRAEFGANPRRYALAVVEGAIHLVERRIGQCVCVTCGMVKAWDSGIKGIHAGHFVASRANSILFDETNIAPQCSHCNYYRSGAPQAFQLWMQRVRPGAIERLREMKTQARRFTREELVDMRLEFRARLKSAVERMK